MAVVERNGTSYHINNRVKIQLETKVVKALDKKDKDYVMIIDGPEGSGKSTLAIQLACFVDPSFTIDRICFTPEEFRNAIMHAEKGQCVIYDEAFTGLSSRATLSEINRMLVSLMMQMRQKNLFVIISLPTFFMLERYVALFRAAVLLHVYEKRGVRGYYLIFTREKKKKLYLFGRKAYNYNAVKSGFTGRFYGKFALGEEKEAEYRAKKLVALQTIEKKTKEVRALELRDRLLYIIYKELVQSARKLESIFKRYDYPLHRAAILEIITKIEGTSP